MYKTKTKNYYGSSVCKDYVNHRITEYATLHLEALRLPAGPQSTLQLGCRNSLSLPVLRYPCGWKISV